MLLGEPARGASAKAKFKFELELGLGLPGVSPLWFRGATPKAAAAWVRRVTIDKKIREHGSLLFGNYG